MEIEAKYTLTEPVSAEQIEALDWGAYQLGDRHTIDQHDTFFDTPKLALSRTRHAVRLRTGGKQPVVTLKGPGSAVQGVHSREEWEEPTADPDPGGWPELIRHKLQDLIAAQPMEPLLAVHNNRRTWELLRDGQIVGEVALDLGEIVAGDEREPMHELEIELKGGTHDDLAAIGELVQRQLPAQPEDRSKFARGLALVRHAQSLTQTETTMQHAASSNESDNE
ncbi:MAG: CYTH domain-containing protein [Chloroflexi bacterium]|nr:CYTH domain-containing protein [Chloroflexota bacterium]